jgi:hypothetical protein
VDWQAIYQRLLDSGLATPTSIQGCSKGELLQIEHFARRALPLPYRDFMLHFGKGAGRFLRDVEVFFPDVLRLKPIAVEILQDREDLTLVLPATAFVFAMRNREQFVFFTNEGDDPPVQFYVSGGSAISTAGRTFGEFIAGEIDCYEQSYRQIKNSPYDLYSGE